MTAVASPEPTTTPLPTVDLYRDIHKAIRAELFGCTLAAGSVDPSDDGAVAGVAERVRGVVALLLTHAEHEDAHVQPAVERHAPELAAVVAADHVALEERMAALEVLADAAAGAGPAERRGRVHRLYLALASFTAAYLEHQAVEEDRVMPALAAALPPAGVLEVFQAIVGSIPPEEMAASLTLMLPAMNLDDRAELLGGMRAGAPPEVFAGVRALAATVLAPADDRALAARLGEA